MKRKYKLTAEVAALAGKIMLESHAESYRVEDTVRRILQTTGLSITEVVSTTTGLFITLDDDDVNVDPITVVRRVSERGNQLNKIYRVNNISRLLTSGQITIEEAYDMLQDVEVSEYTSYSKDLATILLVVGFAILLGGNWAEIIISVLAGSLVTLTRLLKEWLSMNSFIHGIISTFITSFTISILVFFLPFDNISQDIIIIAAFMPLYPGTAFTNGIRDTLKGDYVSGVARIADALVIALSLAIGVALALYLYKEVLL